jgi:hypothetical protein
VFKNRILRRIFGPNRDEIIEDWRKLHNEQLHNVYCLPDKIRMMKPRKIRWAGYLVRMMGKRNSSRILVGNLEGNRPLEIPRYMLEDNIKWILEK